MLMMIVYEPKYIAFLCYCEVRASVMVSSLRSLQTSFAT
jgi:hypothetical protein